MKTKLFLLASLLTFTLAACEEQDAINPMTETGNDAEEPGKLSERALLDFSLNIPIGAKTGIDDNIYEKLQSVDVFIFDETGAMDSAGHIRFDDIIGSFTEEKTDSGIVYNLNSSGIVTNPGIKLVWFGINVPYEMFEDFDGTSEDLISAIQSLRDNYDSSSDSFLFSDFRSAILEKDMAQTLDIKQKHFQWFVDYGNAHIVVEVDPWDGWNVGDVTLQ
jgi:hypothetical protein